jgi:DNA polymerase III sliding clamp (beta) subunit (PCNA family)
MTLKDSKNNCEYQFDKSMLSKIMSFLSPYLAPKMPLSIRILKDGYLEFFTTAGLADGGSALIRIRSDKSAPATTWKHVDGTTLQGIVSNADDDVITFDFGDQTLTIHSSPRTTSKLIYMALDKWKDMTFADPSATIKGKDLNMIAMMTEAASTDESRPGLNGIYLTASRHKIETAAADGYILSFASIQSGEIEVPGSLYSVRALNRAKRALKVGDDEDVKIGFGLDGAGIIPGFVLSIVRDEIQALLHVPQMEGSFPDYKQITKGAPKGLSIEIETSAMNSMLKRANAIEGSIFFQVLNGFLWFMSTNEVTKQKSVDSLAINVEGDSIVMHYAASLLKDTLKACAANGKVRLTFPAVSNAPMLFEGNASVIAMPLTNPLKESPFKNLQPALI